MPEALTYAEIQQQYAGQGVLIAYTELDENLRPIAGQVLAHGGDRESLDDALLARGDRGVAIECFVESVVGFIPGEIS